MEYIRIKQIVSECDLKCLKTKLQFIIDKSIKQKMYLNTLNVPQAVQNETGSKLELFISARGLYDMDVFSKSDPYVKVFFKKSPKMPFAVLGRTETVDNNLNPNFKKSFIVDYIFQAKQEIRFEVNDEDDQSNQKNDDFIGKVQTTLGALAGAKDQTSILTLQNANKNNNVGKLIIRVEPVTENNISFRMKWRARKLTNTDSWFDWWDKSDPYLKFLKIRNDNTFIEAARTDIVMNNLDPDWKIIEVPLARLIRENSPDGKFKIQCWDWEEEGEVKHQFIGEAFVTLNDFKLNKQYPLELALKNAKIKNPGYIVLESFEEYIKPSFFDYLRGGLQLNLSIAVDFTASNGSPKSSSSLHYMDKYKPNQYQQAIIAVSNILLNYDSDKRIPAFGFGAKLNYPNMYSTTTAHSFPLSGNPNQIQAFGLDHLLQLYANALKSVELSGPTYFAPLLNQFINIARISEEEGSNTYQILLILTDGQIHDMSQTVDLLVANCNLPLSIIIVGVGSADFSNMNTLDGDNGLYNANGKKATRDMVQFVPFREVQMNSDLLAQELLAELPTQVTQFMSLIGKPPGQHVQINMSEFMTEHPNAQYNMGEALKQNLPKFFQNLTLKNGSTPI